MDINNIPKKYLLAAISVLVVILLLVTFLQPTRFRYENKGVTAEDQAKAEAIKKQYAEYLATIQPDPEASKKLFRELIDEKEVQKQVEVALKTNQKIVIPEIADSKLAIKSETGQGPVDEYFKTIEPIVKQYANNTGTSAPRLFNDADPEQLAIDTNAALDQLYKTPVPTEAVAYHKAEIGTMEQIVALTKSAEMLDEPKADPWPGVYQQYAVINDQTKVVKDEFNKLDKQYTLTTPRGENAPVLGSGSPLIKTANAQFAVVVTDDIWANIEKIAREALASAFANFMNKFLDKLITDIQDNYYVANFLYYTDALVRGQYVNDYLDKYVTNALDKQLITRFIPQFNCANNKADLGPIFVAKAREYLGFDPSTIDPNSSDFYSKMTRLPDLEPQIQELNFKGAAQTAMIRANESAIIEQLTPTGTKLPRSDVLGKKISTTVASINASLQAAFNAKLGLGTNNTQSVVSQIVSSAINQFTDKYIFKGVVLKEQNTCIALPQLKPIVPGADTPGTPTTF